MDAIAADGRGVLMKCSECGQTNRVPFERLSAVTRCGKCKRELPALADPIEASTEVVFAGLRSADLPVLVDFWAEWCGPCKVMGPELAKFARAASGRVAVAKVNTESAPGIAQRFAISAIPTLALFAGGKELARVQGARSSAQLDAFVRQQLQAAR